MKRTLGWLMIVLAVAAMSYWYATGHHMFTQTQVSEVVTEKDDVFGEETKKTVWHDQLQLGLDWLGSGSGALLVIGTVLLVLDKRQRKRATQTVQ